MHNSVASNKSIRGLSARISSLSYAEFESWLRNKFYNNYELDKILEVWNEPFRGNAYGKPPSLEEISIFGPGAYMKSEWDEVSKNESKIQLLKHLKHQARFNFNDEIISKKFHNEPPAWFLDSQKKLIQIQSEISPEKESNKVIYDRYPELYWHYAVYLSHLGKTEDRLELLREAQEILTAIKNRDIASQLYSDDYFTPNSEDPMNVKIDNKLNDIEKLIPKEPEPGPEQTLDPEKAARLKRLENRLQMEIAERKKYAKATNNGDPLLVAAYKNESW